MVQLQSPALLRLPASPLQEGCSSKPSHFLVTLVGLPGFQLPFGGTPPRPRQSTQSCAICFPPFSARGPVCLSCSTSYYFPGVLIWNLSLHALNLMESVSICPAFHLALLFFFPWVLAASNLVHTSSLLWSPCLTESSQIRNKTGPSDVPEE